MMDTGQESILLSTQPEVFPKTGIPQDSCRQNSAITCWLPKDTQSLCFMLQFCRQSSLWRLLQSCRSQFPHFKATADGLMWATATAGHQYICT